LLVFHCLYSLFGEGLRDFFFFFFSFFVAFSDFLRLEDALFRFLSLGFFSLTGGVTISVGTTGCEKDSALAGGEFSCASAVAGLFLLLLFLSAGFI